MARVNLRQLCAALMSPQRAKQFCLQIEYHIIYILISSIYMCNRNRYINSEKTHSSSKRFGRSLHHIYIYIYMFSKAHSKRCFKISIDAQRKTLLVNVSTCAFISIASQIRKNVHITKNTIDVLFNNFKRNLPSTRCE